MIAAALLQELGNGRLEPEIKSLAAELSRRGIPCTLFLEKRLQRRQLPLRPDTLVAGHIPVVLCALRQLGIGPPEPNDYPKCLQPWIRRRMWMSTVRKLVTILQEGTGAPCFAKPIGRHKRFVGHVFESWEDLRALRGASDNMPIVCSEIVSWLTEYRVYVVRGQIVGIRHYRGDPERTPDQRVIESAVAAFEASGEATAGYGIDFGVLSNGQTALVEVNDGYSLGSYGLEDHHYTDLIVARWRQLMAAAGAIRA